jgi:hypothetical protein
MKSKKLDKWITQSLSNQEMNKICGGGDPPPIIITPEPPSYPSTGG